VLLAGGGVACSTSGHGYGAYRLVCPHGLSTGNSSVQLIESGKVVDSRLRHHGFADGSTTGANLQGPQ
jgi:hypothetical protein